MRRPVALLLGLGLLTAAAGCRSCDHLEAELRTRERELRELREELLRTEALTAALQRDLRAVPPGPPLKPHSEPVPLAALKRIVLGRQTGGYDDDKCPGDEALQVVLEPRDLDDHAVKAPGSLHVLALQISPEGLKTPLSEWDIPPEQLRRTWRSGLLSTGYHLILPWKNWPASEKVRVIVQLTLADGQVFETDRDVTVRLLPPAYRTPLPADEPGPLLHDAELPLPFPRRVNSSPASRYPTGAPSRQAKPEAANAAAWWKAPPPGPASGAVQLLRPVPLP
jgi:hypothetical protein